MDPPEKPPSPPDPLRPEDGFEFELTDIDEARRILDADSLSQFDVASVASPDHWKRLRRAKLPTDRALTGQAIDWLTALPPALRPDQLSRQFPRITNALAEVWHEPDESRWRSTGCWAMNARAARGFRATCMPNSRPCGTGPRSSSTVPHGMRSRAATGSTGSPEPGSGSGAQAQAGGTAATAFAFTRAALAIFSPSSTRGLQVGARALLASVLCADSTYCTSAGAVRPPSFSTSAASSSAV